MGVPEEGGEREREREEIMAENFPSLRKEMDIKLQEAQKSHSRMNPKRSIPRETL